jgi:hypothetical protein
MATRRFRFIINYKLNAALYEDQLARELERDFERDLADCAGFDAAAAQKGGRSPVRLSPINCEPCAYARGDYADLRSEGEFGS